MATLVLATGFEHGLSNATSLVKGNATCRFADTLSGSPTMVSTGNVRTGTYCLELNPSAAQEWITWDTNTIGTSKNVLVGGFAFMFPTLPTADFDIGYIQHAVLDDTVIKFRNSDDRLVVSTHQGNGTVQGPVVVANTWYWVDFRETMSGNPHTMDWAVDGVAQTQYTFAGAADTHTLFAFGDPWNSQTGTVRADDLLLSVTTGDYPLGKHKVRLLKPDTAATATQSGTNNATSTFTANATIGTTFNSANVLSMTSEVPPLIGASASGFTQRTLSTTSYAELPMTTYALQAGESITGLMVEVVGWAGSATTNSLGLRTYNGTTETILFATADPNFDADTAAPGWIVKMATAADFDTQGELDALAIRIGFSGDVTPNPGAHAIYAEVAIKEAVSQIVNGTATGSFGFTGTADGTVIPPGGTITPPTFVADYEGTAGYGSTATPKTTSGFNGALGDVLVSLCGEADDGNNENFGWSSSPTETWTERAESSGGLSADAWVQTATAILTAARTGMTVSVARIGGDIQAYNHTVAHFTGSDGIGNSGASGRLVATSGATWNVTTTYDNSDIVAIFVDWNASINTARTYRTVNGAAGIELTYYDDTTQHSVLVARWHDVGAAGSKTIGITAPTGGTFVGAFVEVRGKVSAGGAVVEGTTTGVFGFTGTATGETTKLGTSSQSFGFTATATGSKIVEGAATGGFGFSAPASGASIKLGTSTTPFGFTATAAGGPERLGTATGSFGFSATAAGSSIRLGTATGSFGFAATAQGESIKIATATGSFTFTATATGTVVGSVQGTATGSFGFSAPATGTREQLGTSTVFFGFLAPATGQATKLGTSTSDFGFLATAQGSRLVTGAATGSFGFTSQASGEVTKLGTSAVSFGFSAPASGISVKLGTGTADFGFSATAAGAAIKVATATGAFGFSVTATGTRLMLGTATGVFGFSAPAAGLPFTPGVGTATGVFGFSAPASGQPVKLGTATGAFGFAGSASGASIRLGTATGTFGFTATATGVKIPPITGTALGAFGFSAPATGTISGGAIVTGTALGVLGFSAPSAGTPIRPGTAVGLFGFSAPANGVAITPPIVLGSALGVFGFSAPANGVVLVAPLITGEASGVFGFSSGATGTVIIKGIGTATGIFGFSAPAVGVREGLDMATDLLGFLLHEFLACSFASLSEKPGRAFVAPGADVAWDDCCKGQLWVRTISLVPSTSTSRNAAQTPCGVILWNAVLGVGVVRCVSTMDDLGNPPADTSLSLEADQMGKDRADLEESIMCCWDKMPAAQRVSFVRWVPLGPQGGCAGGEWHVGLTIDHCNCA